MNPTYERMQWSRRVHADSISASTGVDTNDLYIMNREFAPDPLDLLILEQELNTMSNTMNITMTDNVPSVQARLGVTFQSDALRLLKRVLIDQGIAFNTFDVTDLPKTGKGDTISEADVHTIFPADPKPQQTDPSTPAGQLTWTPEGIAAADDMVQFWASQVMGAGYWVAAMLFAPRGDFNFKPSVDNCIEAIGIGRTIDAEPSSRVCDWAFDGDALDMQDSQGRKRLSRKQYDIMQNSANTIQRVDTNLRAFVGMGFKVHASREDLYNEVVARLNESAQRKDAALANAQAKLREEVRAMAKATPSYL